MKLIKKTILYSISVCISFFVLDRILVLPLKFIINQSQIRFSRLYRGGLKPNVLILGNSRGVHGFYSPDLSKVLETSVINMSYNGMSTTIAEAIFEDYLEHNSKPNLLVLEVTSVNSEDGLINDLKMYANKSKSLKKILRGSYPSSYFACTVSQLFCYNGEMFLRSLFYFERNDQGWISRRKLTPDFLNVFQVQEEDKHLVRESLGPNLISLQKILNLCKKKNIPVRLVVGPYLPQYTDELVDHDQWMNVIQAAVGDEKIWDYSDAVRDVSGFSDPIHLNIDGSRMLSPQMLEDGFFDISKTDRSQG